MPCQADSYQLKKETNTGNARKINFAIQHAPFFPTIQYEALAWTVVTVCQKRELFFTRDVKHNDLVTCRKKLSGKSLPQRKNEKL